MTTPFNQVYAACELADRLAHSLRETLTAQDALPGRMIPLDFIGSLFGQRFQPRIRTSVARNA